MIYVIATITVQPGTRDKVLASSGAFVAASKMENGCLAYDLHASTTDPVKFVFVEQWDSEDALAAHNASEHMKTFVGAVGSCLAAPPRIDVITPQKVDTR